MKLSEAIRLYEDLHEGGHLCVDSHWDTFLVLIEARFGECENDCAEQPDLGSHGADLVAASEGRRRQ